MMISSKNRCFSKSAPGSDEPLLNDLFVLEMANNHWGDVSRAKSIVEQFSKVARSNGVKAAIKIQLRDVETFVHEDFSQAGINDRVTSLQGRSRYIQKTLRTSLTREEVNDVVKAIVASGCIPLATVFDEKSVDLLVDLDLPAIKIASSDLNDWGLLGRCASIGKPIIISTGGHRLSDVKSAVDFLNRFDIQVAINHCVSSYPSEDHELQLDQIDLLRKSFPGHIVGLSTHEYTDMHSSMLLSYAKGARTWERHVDIPYPQGHEQTDISPYCSTPSQVDEWFKAFHKAKEMCGNVTESGRAIPKAEIDYLNALKRGAYFSRNIYNGEIITSEDIFFAIPLQQETGQLSSGQIAGATWQAKLDCTKNSPVLPNSVGRLFDGPAVTAAE